MENLPKDVLIEMALNLSPPDLISFCASSSTKNKIVCNSDSFWYRKLQKNYPEEFYQMVSGEAERVEIPSSKAKQRYIDKFTFISRRIEDISREFIERVFYEGFSKFLTKEYREELFKALYEIYQKYIVLNDEDGDHDDQVIDLISLLDPFHPSYLGPNRSDPYEFLPELLDHLQFEESVERTKKLRVKAVSKK